MLTRLGAACRQELSDLTLEVYTEALCYQVELSEWERFTRESVSSGRFRWFPPVTELLDALREFRGAPALEPEASSAYERVLGASTYSAEAGASWTYRGVLQKCGKAAAEAFLEAGGHHAFATTWDEGKRRERFITAYVQAARAVPEARLLPAGEEQKLLPAPREITRDEAAAIIRRIEKQPVPREGKAVVVATDERLRILREQAEAIQGEVVTT